MAAAYAASSAADTDVDDEEDDEDDEEDGSFLTGATPTPPPVWTGVPPDVTQVLVRYEEGRKKIMEILSTYVALTLPPVYHLKTVAFHATRPDDRTYDTKQPIFAEMQDNLNWNLIYNVVNKDNSHEHGKTCYKGKTGELKCRMGYPAELLKDEDPAVVEIIYDDILERDTYLNMKDVNESHFFQERNDEQQPLPITCKRCLVLMPPRPLLKDSAYESVELLQKGAVAPACAIEGWDGSAAGEPQYSTEDIDKWLRIINDLHGADKKFAMKVLRQRNSVVVSYSPLLTQCLCSNNAAYPLGSLEQAKAILFYLIKYITKDALKVTLALEMIRDARRKVKTYLSRAPDSGEDYRTGKHLLQKLVNTHNGMREVSDTQAALCLINMPAQFGSNRTTYVFIKQAVAHVKEMLAKNSGATDYNKAYTFLLYFTSTHALRSLYRARRWIS